MKLHFFLYTLILLVSFPAYSQVEQPVRVEIELENDKDDFSVIPAGDFGVVMYTQTRESVDQRNKAKWLFTGYDTDFKEKWKSGYIINEAYGVREHYYDNGYLYLLFGRLNREEVTMAVVNVNTGEIKSIAATLPRKFLINSLKVYRNAAYINGSFQKKASLLYFDLDNNSLTQVPLKFDAPANFESIDIDTAAERVNIVYSLGKRNESYLNIKSFQGKELISDIVIKPEGTDNLLTGKINTINEQEKIILGTYSVKGSSGSNGLYFARLINNSEYVIKYYNFTQFSRFFDFMSDREKERIERKREKRSARGKELNLDYQLLVHDLIKKDDQYLMIAEAYYATYRTEPYTYTTVINGVPVIQTRYVTVFDGWLYTHAIIAGFDKEGNLLWDNSIEMGDFKTFELGQRVSVNVKDDEIVLAYGTYDEIKTKVIRGNQVVDDKEDIAIKTGFATDVIKRAILSNVSHWYDKYFLVWGYQKIKNEKGEEVKRKRTVFYFNKVAYK